jgi:hypothetical protein
MSSRPTNEEQKKTSSKEEESRDKSCKWDDNKNKRGPRLSIRRRLINKENILREETKRNEDRRNPLLS